MFLLCSREKRLMRIKYCKVENICMKTWPTILPKVNILSQNTLLRDADRQKSINCKCGLLETISWLTRKGKSGVSYTVEMFVLATSRSINITKSEHFSLYSDDWLIKGCRVTVPNVSKAADCGEVPLLGQQESGSVLYFHSLTISQFHEFDTESQL